jgi:CelD/BcsL family acetyltransferase involved in cellulose biosynthesis
MIAAVGDWAAVEAVRTSFRGFVISTTAEFERLEDEWNELFRRANPQNVFLSFGWLATWWKHFGKGRLAIVAVRDDLGGLAAVAPLYVARSARALGARRLGFLGDERVGSDYLNLLVDVAGGTAAVAEIARVIFDRRADWDYIELHDCADAAEIDRLKQELESRGMREVEVRPRVCRYISLPDSFDAYLGGVCRSLRTNYRRRWRHLQQQYHVECVTVSQPAELEQYFPTLIALHRMRFKERAAVSAFLASHVPEFHTEALRALAAQGLARLLVLKADGYAVAAIYGFSVGETFQFYQCGMNPRWARDGVGQVLIGNAIEQNIADGHATFDFLRGDERYKTQWAERSHRNVTLRFYDGRVASMAAEWSLKGSEALHGAAHRVRMRLVAKHSAEKSDG